MIVNQCFGTDNRAETCFLLCYDCRKTIETKYEKGKKFMTIYAKQVDYQYQESPLSVNGYDTEKEWPEIAIYGNRDFCDHIPENIERIMNVLNDGELADVLDSFNRRLRDYNTEVYKNVSEAIYDFLKPEHKTRYSTREIHMLNNLVCSYGIYSREDEKILVSVLDIVTGKKWTTSTIRGNCQSDWQIVIYPADVYSDSDIEQLEADYFNTGTEWIIHDEESAPESEDDISGYSVYCYSWSVESIADEILDYAGGNHTDDIVLYPIDGGMYERKGESQEEAA